MIARLNSSLDRSSFSLALSELMESALPFLWLSLLLVVLDISYYLVRSGSVYYAIPHPVPDPSKVIESVLLLAIVTYSAPKTWRSSA